MTGRNVPVRILGGVVQVHVRPAVQPVVAVAAHKRHSHAPEIPYYILSTVIFFVCCTFLRGKIPRSPFAAYAALGILQERPGAMDQNAMPAVPYKYTQAPQYSPLTQLPPTRGTATISVSTAPPSAVYL